MAVAVSARETAGLRRSSRINDRTCRLKPPLAASYQELLRLHSTPVVIDVSSEIQAQPAAREQSSPSASSMAQSTARIENPCASIVQDQAASSYVRQQPASQENAAELRQTRSCAALDSLRSSAPLRVEEDCKDIEASAAKLGQTRRGSALDSLRSSAPLRVGTDCSGIEAPIQALKNIGVDFEHVFSCDIDRNAEKMIKRNFPPEEWHPDLTKRDNRKAPYVDLYVAGFPCQPFSLLSGTRQGFEDEGGRGSIFFNICDYIEHQRPRVFMLENVTGLLSLDGGRHWECIQSILSKIADSGYEISWSRMDTKKHGVPQSRTRVYIVGVLKAFSNKTFSFSDISPLPPASIEGFLDPITRPATFEDVPAGRGKAAHTNVRGKVADLFKQGRNPFIEPFVIDIDSSPHRAACLEDRSPCLTKTRCNGHWVTNRGRRLNTSEMLRLQGMHPDNLDQSAVSDRCLGGLIGNSMSVNVLERILVRLLPSARLVDQSVQLADRWEEASATVGTATLVRSSPIPLRRQSQQIRPVPGVEEVRQEVLREAEPPTEPTLKRRGRPLGSTSKPKVASSRKEPQLQTTCAAIVAEKRTSGAHAMTLRSVKRRLTIVSVK